MPKLVDRYSHNPETGTLRAGQVWEGTALPKGEVKITEGEYNKLFAANEARDPAPAPVKGEK